MASSVPSNADRGRRSPDAPAELAIFGFLVGRWRCTSRVRGPDGTFTSFAGRWDGRYILDGHVIADEWRQFGPSGELMQLGQNYRSYDRVRRAWVLRWHDALASTWLDLAPRDLGGVHVGDGKITFEHHRPPDVAEALVPRGARFRIQYEDIEPDRFAWRAALSVDGGCAWTDVQVIEAERVAEDASKDLLERFELVPLAGEGGYYRESYRSALVLPASALPPAYDGSRRAATAIYYALTPETMSSLHRLRGDEVYHFYAGDPVELLLLHPSGDAEVVALGADFAAGMRPQHVVPAGTWQGSRLSPGGRFALLGTTMAPGFECEDYEAGDRATLLHAYPAQAERIRALTAG